MKDSDIDTLSADEAQNGPNRGDPRAALAEALLDDSTVKNHRAVAERQAKRLAERGVLLVTEPMLEAAILQAVVQDWKIAPQWAALIFAALSDPSDAGAPPAR